MSAPADCQVDAPIAKQQTHIGKSTVAGRAVAAGLNVQGLRTQRIGLPFVAVCAAGVAVAVVKVSLLCGNFGAKTPI